MRFGLEKECLLFDKNFVPVGAQVKSNCKRVTLDFADHQFEIVSDIHDSVNDLYKEILKETRCDVFLGNMIWPFSMPGIIDYDITFDAFEGNDYSYRKYLKDKYNKEMLLLSGIHFNVSDFDDNIFEMYKKIYIYGPLIMQFFSFTPKYETVDIKNAISLRNSSKYGYYNEHLLDLNYDSYSDFKDSIDKVISNGNISSEREVYSKVRVKSDSYLELRFIDLNPFYKSGISLEQLKLLELFMKYLSKIEIREFDMKLNFNNFDLVALNGQDRNLELNINGKIDSLFNHTINMLRDMNILEEDISFIYNDYFSNNLDLDLLVKFLSFNSVDSLGKKLAFGNREYVDKYPDLKLELSTKILLEEASEFYDVNILDEDSNVIEFDNNMIFQATKTNLDHYVDILVLENKKMTKFVLDKNGISTPSGYSYFLGEEIDYSIFKNKKMVIKPLDTNFGLGISMLDIDPTKEDIDSAIERAFSYSKTILIEEFISGKEYRFLVIGGKCVSIVHRVAANVIGDGVRTIRELIDNKNKSDLRGTGYKKPLEKIIIDDDLIKNVKKYGLGLDDIVKKDDIIYLRTNSNVSTGGDSIEMFDQINGYFKDVAVRASNALNVNICGIDMIIEDLDKLDYSIIEANFNPAIHMHAYPYAGSGKNVSTNIISLFK